MIDKTLRYMHFALSPRRASVVLALVAMGSMSRAAYATAVDLPGALPNMFGVGVGSTTEYAGGKDRMIGVVPGLRYVTPGGHLLEWYGPYAQLNVAGVAGFQWGPAIALRLGRRNVDDPVIAQIHEVHTTVEGGGYVGYEYDHVRNFPYRLRGTLTVVTNAGAVYTGARVALNASAWVPVGVRVFVGAGVGATWVSQGFNETYYGVTPADSARSGLRAFHPNGGLQQVTSWAAAVYQLDKNWYGGAMIYYQRLTGSAADSPIVTQRGNRNQVTYGVGLAYAFR